MSGATESKFLSGYPNYKISSGIRATCHCHGVAMDATPWQWYAQLPWELEKHTSRSCTAWLTFQRDALKPYAEVTMASSLIKNLWHKPGHRAAEIRKAQSIGFSICCGSGTTPSFRNSILPACSECLRTVIDRIWWSVCAKSNLVRA